MPGDEGNQVARLLAYVTGLVNQQLLLQVEYLAAENRILREHAPTRLRLSNAQRATLAEIGKRLGRKGLAKVALVAKPETILGWFRKLVAQKFDGSKCRSYRGRPRIDAEVETLIMRMARENSGWGYDRIAGALAHLGHEISNQTVGNVFRRHGIAPAPKRSQTTAWKEFIASHMAVLAGMDFFTAEGGIELDVVIDGLKIPSPKPVRFPARARPRATESPSPILAIHSESRTGSRRRGPLSNNHPSRHRSILGQLPFLF